MKFHMLIVDDEEVVRNLVAEILSDLDIAAFYADSIAAAREQLETIRFDLVITDLILGEENGVDLLAWCRRNSPHTSVILMTGQSDETTVIEALNQGAHAFLSKPFSAKKLRASVESAMEQAAERRREEEIRAEVSDKITRLRQQLVDEVVEKELLFMATLTTLAKAVDARDSYTHQHCGAVAEYAKRTAQAMGLAPGDHERIHTAGLLHDIGKIGVPEHILLKPGKLTDEEFVTIQSHAERGAEILAPLPGMQDIVAAVRSHHERYDGTGYPDCLLKEQTPLFARILAVCDAWDAMTTDRPYRKGMPLAEAKEVLLRERSRQFDPDVVDAFLTIRHGEVILADRVRQC